MGAGSGSGSRVSRWADRRLAVVATAVVILLGLAARLVWLLADATRLTQANSEMFYVARAFAETGHLADAYGRGTGLTAHVTPVMPLLAGGVYRLFGVNALPAELLLTAISLAAVALSLFAVDRAMASLSVAWPARFLGLIGAWLVPLNLALEMRDFRVWEGSVAAAALASILAIIVKADQADRPPGWQTFIGLAATGGVMALVSPPVALGIYGCAGLLALRRRGVGAFVTLAAMSAVLLVAFSYPWALRNEAAFGEKVWSRSNFGFNFALGFHDGAVDPPDGLASFLARLNEVDPYTSASAREALTVSGGEVAYSALWTKRTMDWIADHPEASARIAGRHIVEYYFPPVWQWHIYGNTSVLSGPKAALVWLITALAGMGLAWRLMGRDLRYLYVLAAVSLPAIPYILAQPVTRYRYVIATILAFLAADFCWRLVERLAARRAGAASDPGSRLFGRRMPVVRSSDV